MGNLAINFETHWQSVVAHAHHPRYPIVEIFPAHLEPGTLLGLHDELTADQNHSAFRCFPGKRQFALPYIVLLLYDRSHGHRALADKVVTSAIIDVDHFKLDLLLSFVEIVECEASLEVWVQIVVDLLGLAQFDPLFGQLVKLTQNADGIRLAE